VSPRSLGQIEEPVRVRIPADLDTPDRVAFGLTLRQLAVVGVFAVPAYVAWQTLTGLVPLPVLAAGTAPLAALALMLAVGRRDGLPMDAWLLAAAGHARRPRRASPSGRTDTPGRSHRVGVLRFPACVVSTNGVITRERTGRRTPARLAAGPAAGSAAAMVAVRTITSGLHTPAEQAALMGGYARWLNGLSGPVQIVVSSRPVDLPARALRIAESSAFLSHPGLAQAAVEHAEHLLDLCEDGEPRARTVTVVCTATTTGVGATASAGAAREALRRAERTAAALGGLSPTYGTGARVLDGGQVTGVLACASDVYGPAGMWARTRPDDVVAGDPRDIGTYAAGDMGSDMGSDVERWS
jgi:hypothetical protein